MRLGCSMLNAHQSLILQVSDNPYCNCGNYIEIPKHYFLECQLYAAHRVNLINRILRYAACDGNVISFGKPTLSKDINTEIMQALSTSIN